MWCLLLSGPCRGHYSWGSQIMQHDYHTEIPWNISFQGVLAFASRPMEPSCQLAQLVLRLFLLCGMGSDQRYRALQDGHKIVAVALPIFCRATGWELLLSCDFCLPLEECCSAASCRKMVKRFWVKWVTWCKDAMWPGSSNRVGPSSPCWLCCVGASRWAHLAAAGCVVKWYLHLAFTDLVLEVGDGAGRRSSWVKRLDAAWRSTPKAWFEPHPKMEYPLGKKYIP